jgi:hypothetical protein
MFNISTTSNHQMILKKPRISFLLPCPIKIVNEWCLEGKLMSPSSKAKKPVLIKVKTFCLLKVDCNEGCREDSEC